MSPIKPLPLGARIPDCAHAVSCSLPTLRDVIGYEERHAATVARMRSGYPRFVIHPLLLAVVAHWKERFGLGHQSVWPTSSGRMSEVVAAALAPAPARLLEHDGIHGVAHADTEELRTRAKALLQHTGGFLSSRAAEDYAARNGIAPAGADEALATGDAPGVIRDKLASLFAPAAVEDILLAPSGMNAFWAAFQAVSKLQRVRGRDHWLQIGWLYLDTGAILTKFTGGRIVRVFDVNDHAAIEAVFREHGPRLAGVVTEVTTNPLMQTPDIPWLAGLARAHGALMLVDPTIVSPFNVDVVPHADVVLNSLTKYAACEGDVIAGAVLLTPGCPDRERLRSAIVEELEPVYPRDLARLAHEIGAYEDFVRGLNTTTRAVVDHLLKRARGIRRLCWSGQPGTGENYLRLARGPERIGPVISFEIDGAMERFYDAVPLAKGPSFGIRASLLCPYVYLAHYDLITSPEGRRLLGEARLSPDLLRLSIGSEPPDEIIASLETGFAAAGLS